MVAPFRELTLEQRRQVINTEQVWEAWKATSRRNAGYTGSMGWRTSKGRTYLVRQTAEAGTRRMTSLGPRSPETETTHREFHTNRKTSRTEFKTQSNRLIEMSRLNRALRLTRVEDITAKVLRALDTQGLLGTSLSVVGTNAIYAYEAASGFFIDTSLLATDDLDIMLDARARIRLRGSSVPPSLMAALTKADPSFRRQDDRGFSAVNEAGFHVDLIKAPPRNVISSAEPDTLGDDRDLHAAHIPNMRWILNAPRFSSMAIGADGFPVPMICPDPRAFALYKLWMARRDQTRDPRKRFRDLEQAKIVAALVNDHMPHLPFEPEHLKCFPIAATSLAANEEFFRLARR